MTDGLYAMQSLEVKSPVQSNLPQTRSISNSAEPAALRPAPLAPAARAGLWLLFQLARHTPRLLTAFRPLAITLALCCCTQTRRATAANANRLLGPGSTARDRRRYARRVVGCFFDFVVDLGRVGHRPLEQLRAEMDRSRADAAFLQARATGTGAIVLTAHMGSFETGLALLADVEPNVHVVFKRDAMDGFENIRRAWRKKLGVSEVPIDDGWPTWIALRDALEADQVVVMQGDRAWPGQKSATVPLCAGHIRLPLGPFKLAQITASPIIPIFSERTPEGGIRLIVEPPIHVDTTIDLSDGLPDAVREWAAVLERHIVAHPQQWLVLEPAFVEDHPTADSSR